MKHFVATHPKTVKAAIITLQVVTIASAFLDDGASAAALPEEEGLEGEATAIENVTEGGSVNNIKADLSPEEFGKNLEESGYTRSTASDGHVQYTNGEKTYTIYQSSSGVPSAQVKVGSQIVSKIRLNPE